MKTFRNGIYVVTYKGLFVKSDNIDYFKWFLQEIFSSKKEIIINYEIQYRTHDLIFNADITDLNWSRGWRRPNSWQI